MHNLKLIEDITIRPNMHFAMIACGLFILISGATITYSNNNRDVKPMEFYKKRLIRVLIPFYIAYIIYFVIKVISLKNIFIYGGVPKWRFIWTILGMDEYLNAYGIKTFSLGVGEWFLGCIILCYLVYPFLYKAHKKNKIITFLIMIIYYVVLNVNYDKFSFAIPRHMNFLSQVYNFYLGIVFSCGAAHIVRGDDVAHIVRDDVVRGDVGAKHREPAFVGADIIRPAVGAKHREPVVLLAITVPIILFFYFYKPIINISDNFKTTIVVVAIVTTTFLFENVLSKNNFLNNITSLFNKISYEFFLVHHFVIYQIDFMLNYRRLSGIETLVVILLDLLITIAIAIIVRIISNKIIFFLQKK